VFFQTIDAYIVSLRADVTRQIQLYLLGKK